MQNKYKNHYCKIHKKHIKYLENKTFGTYICWDCYLDYNRKQYKSNVNFK